MCETRHSPFRLTLPALDVVDMLAIPTIGKQLSSQATLILGFA